MLIRSRLPVLFFLFLCIHVSAQQNNVQSSNPKLKSEREIGLDTTSSNLTLNDCLRYALKNQPALNQSYLDEAIARASNRVAQSAWLPQVGGAGTLQHYIQTPTSFIPVNGNLTAVQSGIANYSIPSISASQTIFSPEVLLAARASKLNTLASRQQTGLTKIQLVSDVSKAFYDLLLSIQQIGVYRDDTARLRKNRDDAYNRYVSGIVDKVDYMQATISLNNSLSQLKTATGAVDAKYATLQQYMGFPPERKFSAKYDTSQMLQEIYIDTNARLQIEKRIEYQQLETQRKIQHETTAYYQLGFLPSVSAVYNYYYEFQSSKFSELYSKAYPYSLFGLQLNIPIFTGFRRTENVRMSKLQERRTDWDAINLRLTVYTEYKQALANYKSNLYYLATQRENVDMAREVYNIVRLQYREGIKAYLDVIVAESDVQTSEINYLNALFHLLESKIDLEQAMGDIPTVI
jgi:outer membrane protein TolC